MRARRVECAGWIPARALRLAGMTGGRAAAYPRSLALWHDWACRCLRRDVDGPIHRLTWQRPAPGRRAVDGSRSRRPGCDRSGEAPAMARSRRPPSGSRCDREVPATGRAGSQSICARDTNRRTRVPQGSPGTRAGSQGARRGSQGGPQPSLPGRVVPAPGLPTRHPRTRRTLAGFPAGADGAWRTKEPPCAQRSATVRPDRPCSASGRKDMADRPALFSGVAEPYSTGVALRGAVRLSGKAKNKQHTPTEETL